MFVARCVGRSCYRAILIKKELSQSAAFSLASSRYAGSKSVDGVIDRAKGYTKEIKVLIGVAATAALGWKINVALDEDWEAFKIKYGKKYRDATEEKYRRAVWEENAQVVKEHNARHARGEVSFTLGENEFADMTTSEFVGKMNGLRRSCWPWS